MPHWLYDAAVPIGTIVVALLGFYIKWINGEQTKDLKKDIGDVLTTMKVHIAEDEIIHDGIEKRVSNIENRWFSRQT